MMKSLNGKKQERIEKKKKKLAALANMVQLNEYDRRTGAIGTRNSKDKSQDEDTEKESVADDAASGFIKVSHKKKVPCEVLKSAATIEIGPNIKRVKLSISEKYGHLAATCIPTSHTKEELDLMKLKSKVTAEQYDELCSQLRQRKHQLGDVPGIRLRETGVRASLETPQEERTPIFLTDIQHLLMSALIGKKSPCTPDRWCYLEKTRSLSHSVVLVLEGLSLYHYLSNQSNFEETNKIFKTRLEVVLPSCKRGNIIEELAQVPLTNVQTKELVEQYGSLASAVEMNKDPTLFVKAIFPIADEPFTDYINEMATSDKFPRTKLLLSALQMVDEGYPMPLRGELHKRFQNFVFTKTKYAPVTAQSPMFGVDCEMCRTAVGYNELTRISIVNEKLETVYETLVMPTNKIVDYLTRYSGITPEIMKAVTKNLKDVQTEVQALLPPDAILVGQSLNFDLNAMQMMHPYVIDTSVCFNLSGERRRKAKLQTLAMTFLKESIQENLDGHDSVEDSLASLKLVKMKLANSMEFGDEILIQRKRFEEVRHTDKAVTTDNDNILPYSSKRDKRTAIISAGEIQPEAKDILQKAQEAAKNNSLKTVTLFELETNKEAVKKSREIALENSLTIINLHLGAEKLNLDVAEKTIQKIDKWIGKLWKSLGYNGMFVVLFGGSEECPSGIAKIATKKNLEDVVLEVPIFEK